MCVEKCSYLCSNDIVASALTAYAESEGFANYHVFADKTELLSNISEYSHVITAENIDEIADSTDHLTVRVIHLT